MASIVDSRKLCSTCVRELGYNVRCPQLLVKYLGCDVCNDMDRVSIDEEELKEQIRIVGEQDELDCKHARRWSR